MRSIMNVWKLHRRYEQSKRSGVLSPGRGMMPKTKEDGRKGKASSDGPTREECISEESRETRRKLGPDANLRYTKDVPVGIATNLQKKQKKTARRILVKNELGPKKNLCLWLSGSSSA